ncbi:hypothetical protein GCM10010234_77020 [Streptomyces hawaiiensis]
MTGRLPHHGQDVHVTVRTQTAEGGGAVQVDAEEGVTEGGSEEPDEMAGVRLLGHVRSPPRVVVTVPAWISCLLGAHFKTLA